MSEHIDDRFTRVLLLALAASGLVVGVWAAFAPHSFYTDFPGGGRHWVGADGPYNEHLVRDVGNLFLGLSAVALFAAAKPVRHLVIATAAGFGVEGVLHFAYHLRHLDVYDATDKAGNVVSLGAGAALPLLLLLWVLVLAPRRAGSIRS